MGVMHRLQAGIFYLQAKAGLTRGGGVRKHFNCEVTDWDVLFHSQLLGRKSFKFNVTLQQICPIL